MFAKLMRLIKGVKWTKSHDRRMKQITSVRTQKKSGMAECLLDMQTIGIQSKIDQKEYFLRIRKDEILEYMDEAEAKNDERMKKIAHEKTLEFQKDFESLKEDYRKLKRLKKTILVAGEMHTQAKKDFKEATASHDPLSY